MDNKWTKEATVLRESIFNILFKDQIGKREEKIRNMETKELIAEFQNKKNGNVSLCREELKQRYLAERDKDEIAEALRNSTKSDQQWVKSQISHTAM